MTSPSESPLGLTSPAEMREVIALLGHTSQAMTARYLRLRESPVVQGPGSWYLSAVGAPCKTVRKSNVKRIRR